MSPTATSRASAALRGSVADMTPVDLDTVLDRAELQTRTDRKYLVPLATFSHLVAELADTWAVLEIDRRRLFGYESTYYDTPSLQCYRDHARGRPHRFKVRTRTYTDTAHSVLEVKTKGRRDQTIKDRLDYEAGLRHLDDRGIRFVTDRIGDPDTASRLGSVLSTTYSRSTLVDPSAGNRLTCDVDLHFAGAAGHRDVLAGYVLVETKSPGLLSTADHALRALGVHPEPISKYSIAHAVLDPALPANRWNRTMRRYFEWQPTRPAGPGTVSGQHEHRD